MAEFVFKLPDVGEGTAEAEIVAWHVAPGQEIEEDAPLVDVMTDKATVEMTTPVTGKVLAIHGEPGEMAAVGSTLAVIEVEGEGNQPSAATASNRQEATEGKGRQDAGITSAPSSGARASSPQTAQSSSSASGQGGRALVSSRPAAIPRAPGVKPLASPAVRRHAHELGVPLQFVPGSGPGGRIGHDDLEAYLADPERRRPAGIAEEPAGSRRYGASARRSGESEIKVIGLRRRIAEKMQQAKRRIPHFAYVEEVDVTELEALRIHLNQTKRADQPKLTVLPFLIVALTRLLPRYPQINATFDDEAGVVTQHAAVHLGMATQTPNGLVVPVIRHAEAMDLWELANEIARLAARHARGQGQGRRAARLDHYPDQPWTARRRRHHAGDQPSGGGDHRPQQDHRPASGAGRRHRHPQDDERLLELRSSRGRRLRRRRLHPGAEGDARAPGHAVHGSAMR